MSFAYLKRCFSIIFLGLLAVYALGAGIYGFYFGLNPDSNGIFGPLPQKALYSPAPQNYVTKWEHDIASLKEKIPAGQTHLGYLADWDLHPDSASPDQYVFYYLTQYSLAPIWIDRGIENEWIILYTSEPKPYAWLNAHLRSHIVESVGYRFFLIHQNMSK